MDARSLDAGAGLTRASAFTLRSPAARPGREEKAFVVWLSLAAILVGIAVGVASLFAIARSRLRVEVELRDARPSAPGFPPPIRQFPSPWPRPRIRERAWKAPGRGPGRRRATRFEMAATTDRAYRQQLT
jgi:hypothetical protein